MENFYVIIPSLNPDNRILTLIDSLKAAGVLNIVIVNDGSKSGTLSYFTKAEQKGCTILHHAVNLGKGYALKTAFNYIASKDEHAYAVCADSDGQHLITDILRIKDALLNSPDALILGSRDFDDENVPNKSRYGNKITRTVVKLLYGVNIRDTQTGLRGLSAKTMKKFLKVKGERFEYEMNMLIDAKNLEVPIEEIPISTVYIDENKSTHFNPIKDSIRIYSVFFKYIASSLFSFLVDILLFTFFLWLCKRFFIHAVAVLTATAVARICSSLVNYFVNKNGVFKSKQSKSHTIVKYYILCVLQLLCSALLVSVLSIPFINAETFIKVIVDTLLFLVSFRIQRAWVFK